MNIQSTLFGFCLLLGLLFPGASAIAQDAVIQPGLLWKLESPSGVESYLFGTMHTDDERLIQFPDVLKEAIASSRVFLMEVLPPKDQEAFLMKEGRLDAMLGRNEINKVLKMAEIYGLAEDMAMQMKPWLLAMVLSPPRQHSPFPQDLQLYALALQDAKQVDGLESTAEHFGMLDDLPQKDQLALLRAVVTQSDKDKQNDFDRLLAAYLSEDTQQIARLDEEMSSAPLPKGLWEKMRVRLLDRRNIRMALRIAEQASQEKVFVAVGAAHLPGEGGLIARLRAAGFRAEPVTGLWKR